MVAYCADDADNDIDAFGADIVIGANCAGVVREIDEMMSVWIFNWVFHGSNPRQNPKLFSLLYLYIYVFDIVCRSLSSFFYQMNS